MLSIRVDTGRFAVFMMACWGHYLQVDSISFGKARAGGMLTSFIMGSVCSAGSCPPIGLSCQMQGPRSPGQGSPESVDSPTLVDEGPSSKDMEGACKTVTITKDQGHKLWMEARKTSREGMNTLERQQRTPAAEYLEF